MAMNINKLTHKTHKCTKLEWKCTPDSSSAWSNLFPFLKIFGRLFMSLNISTMQRFTAQLSFFRETAIWMF